MKHLVPQIQREEELLQETIDNSETSDVKLEKINNSHVCRFTSHDKTYSSAIFNASPIIASPSSTSCLVIHKGGAMKM